MNAWVGKQLGQYQITAEIGRGGMAVVYQAWQPSLGRSVAIKMLPPHLASDQDFLARFRREAMAAAQLNHPNIVTIHDVGQEGNNHFIVMEYLEGQSLYDILRTSGPMPLERVLHLVEQVALALDYAHQRGFVHRDIKPANILVGPDDHVTLTDFGIAKAASGTSLTQTGTMVGTPQYMAPEQVQGAEVDSRTDVYALGIVCYEMLSGVPPFTGDTAAVLYAQAHKPPPSLRQHLPRLATHVEYTLERALAKDPGQRFASAGELVAALGPSPTPTVAAPRPAPSRSSASVPLFPQPGPASTVRRRLSELNLGVLLGVGVAAVVLVAVAAFVLLSGSGAAETTETSTPTSTHAATERPASFTPSVASVTTSTPDPNLEITPSRTASESTIPTAQPSTPLRLAFVLGNPGNAKIYRIDADGADRRRLVEDSNDQAEPDWSPDGQRVAYQSNRAGNYDIWGTDAEGQEQRQLTTDEVDEREPDWSPDGQQIVFRRGGEPNGDGELWVMQANGENQRRLGDRLINGRAPVWSPDGQQVAFMSEQSGTWNIYLYDLNRDSIRRLTNCSAHCRFPNWSSDGTYLVYHSTQSASSFTPVTIWRQQADGRGEAEILVEGNNPGRAVWSIEELVAFNTDNGIAVMNADGSDRRLLPNSDEGWAPDWSR